MSALENVISAYIQQLAAQNLPNFKIAVMGVLQLLLSVEMSLFEDTMYPDYGPKVAQASKSTNLMIHCYRILESFQPKTIKYYFLFL